MEYLVTGGAGFIGSHLVERLVKDGGRVRVLDNYVTGKRENLAPYTGKIDLVEGDMADPAVCQRACSGVRVVLHEAALPSVPKSVADPVASHRSNIQGTFNLLIAAKDAKVQRFVYAGSSSAYGESETLPKVESMASSPLSPYAVQKLTGEYYCTVFARCYECVDDPLFQRLRPAAGPEKPICRGDPGVHYSDSRKPTAHRLRRRRADAGLYLYR